MGVNWNLGLMRWMPHINGEGEAFPLNHLHPFRYELNLERGVVNISVGFAMHCFTRGCLPDDDITNFYKDDREVRTFCNERYSLSYQLPITKKAFL